MFQEKKYQLTRLDWVFRLKGDVTDTDRSSPSLLVYSDWDPDKMQQCPFHSYIFSQGDVQQDSPVFEVHSEFCVLQKKVPYNGSGQLYFLFVFHLEKVFFLEIYDKLWIWEVPEDYTGGEQKYLDS